MSWKKRRRAFAVALRGIATLWREGLHFRLMVAAAALTLLLATWLQVATWEWVLLIWICGTVLAAEGLNSALEFLVDLASPNYHKLAEKAKDAAAGAVLLLSIAALLIGLLIFIPKLL